MYVCAAIVRKSGQSVGVLLGTSSSNSSSAVVHACVCAM